MNNERAQERKEVAEVLERDPDAAWERFCSVEDPEGPDLRLLRKIAWKQLIPERTWAFTLQLAGRADESASNVASAAGSALRAGDPEGALELADRGLEQHPDDPGLLAVSAQIRIARGDGAEALEPWLATDPEARHQAVGLLVQAGAIDRARTLAEELDDRLWRARFALWSVDLPAATALLEGLDGPDASVVRAAVAVLDGRPDEGLAELDAVLAADPTHGLAHQWRSEALIRLERPSDAVGAADLAARYSRKWSLCARILRCLAMQLDAPRSAYLSEALRDEVLVPIAPIVGSDPPRTVEMLEQVLAAFGGNRTPTPTLVADGGLTPLPLPVDPRDRARRAQAVLKVRGPEAAREVLEQIVADTPDEPLARTHLGEIELWCGRVDAARTAFEAALAIDDRTRWAWVGLGACAMLDGDFGEALRLWQHCIDHTGAAGPTLWAYQGETQRRMGDLDEAERSLNMAFRMEPRRLGTRINRALVAAERGDLAPAEALAEHLATLAKGLVGEGSAVEQLETALVRMRGNRSSSLVTWFDDADRLRLLPYKAPQR